jgi:hypothetical protein
MQKLSPRQPTQYPPLEQGQVLEMNDHCMKVNFGFNFIRGVFSGLVALVLFSSLVFDIIIGDLWTEYSLFFGFLDDIANFKFWVIPIVLLELYLWPSAPPMIFDRVNRRVIFQVFFRTKILDWDSCEGSIRYFAQATEASVTQGYNLRIEGYVINLKLGQKKQRATALIHQSGVSEDLYNYWEYIRCYMDGGPEAIPAPSGIHQMNPFWAALVAFYSNIPDPLPIFKAIGSGEGGIKGILKNIIILFLSSFMLLATPLVYPLILMVYIAGRTGRVRRYPKEIRQLCKAGQEATQAPTPQPTPGKLKIHIDGKPLEVDWPVDKLNPSSSSKPSLEE